MSKPGERREAPAAIRPSRADAAALLTLPRGEHAFRALVSALKAHRDKCTTDFHTAASRTVFDDSVRPSALVLSGQVRALNDVLDLLDRLTVGGIVDDE